MALSKALNKLISYSTEFPSSSTWRPVTSATERANHEHSL